MNNQVDVWVSRIVGGFIAVCVGIVFWVAPVAAIVGLVGIFLVAAGIGYIRKRLGLMLCGTVWAFAVFPAISPHILPVMHHFSQGALIVHASGGCYSPTVSEGSEGEAV